MNWGRHLTPWPEHLQPWLNTPEERKRISTDYNLYTQYHPGYLTPKENMVEDNVEMGIKSPDLEGMKRLRDSESHTVAMVITTSPPKWVGNDGYLIQVLWPISQTTIGICTISVLQIKLLL
jgi:hypothetical protein